MEETEKQRASDPAAKNQNSTTRLDDEKNEFNDQDLSIKIKKTKDFLGEFNGYDHTFLAMKSTKTYMIATTYRGTTLIKDYKKIYSGYLPKGAYFSGNMFYSKHLDCIFLVSGPQLLRKDLDDKPPYFYMKLPGKLQRYCKAFRYSNIHSKLVYRVKESHSIAIIDLILRKQTFWLKHNLGSSIKDIKLFGKKENKLLAVTKKGDLVLFVLEFLKKKVLAFKSQRIEFFNQKKYSSYFEKPRTVSVCDQNKYALVQLEFSGTRAELSRLLIFLIDRTTLSLRTVLDQRGMDISNMHALECFGSFFEHLIWVGLAFNKPYTVALYDYDLEKNELREIEKGSVSHQELYPFEMYRFGDSFYYSGLNGTVTRLTLSLDR